MFIQPVIK